MSNLILNTDSYKLSHYLGYPQGTEYVYSYAESRGGEYDEIVVVGLQAFIMKYLSKPVTYADVDEAELFSVEHGEPFNREGWDYIVDQHGGYLPIEIKAVREGTIVPTRNVIISVENTDPKLPWLTSYIETALMRVWYPITVATRILGMKRRIKPYFDLTSDSGDMGFGILDFSSRGVSSYETSEIGGLGHLVHFIGSDNIPAVKFCQKYYGEQMAAFSVPATEHSIMTAFGEQNEMESFEYLVDNMMQENGILSVVSDTWNVYEAAEKWCLLADKIKAKNGTLVFRPDSGKMEEVLPQVLQILEKGFGYTKNSKGFKVLNNVKVLQGDGIDEKSVRVPFMIAYEMGISADSIMTGSGGGLMSHNIDRDTCKFAFKASHVVVNGVGMGIAKNPITDPGKRSKKGKLKLVKDGNDFMTFSDTDPDYSSSIDELQVVYRNGEVTRFEYLEDIRARISSKI